MKFYIDIAGEKSPNVSFDKFQSKCKYMKYGADFCCSTNYYETCRHPDKIPQGHSWGVCDEFHCPYYPKRVKNLVVYDIETKEELFQSYEAFMR